MRTLAALLPAALGLLLGIGQDVLAQHDEPHPKHGTKAPPVHQPRPALPPRLALRHLREGSLRVRQARAAGRELPEPAQRPSGAGRYVAAVIVCADADVDAAALFGQRRKDLLVLSTPGPHVDAAAVALLRRVVSRERLSLCVVLTHDRCESLAPDGDDAAAAKLRERARRARELAARRKIALCDAQALWIRESLLGSTPQLSQRVADGEFLVAPGVVDPRTGAIRWLLTRAQELPMPPVQSR